MSNQAANFVDDATAMAFTMGGAAAARAMQVTAPGINTIRSGQTIQPFGKSSYRVASASNSQIAKLEKKISNWLGEDAKLIRNKSGDPIFLSKDGVRKIRFDFNRPYPHENPHLHFEHLVESEWKEIRRIYPIDVPHK